MVMLFEGTPDQFSMDGYLYENIKTAKDVIKKDWDMVFCIDGSERSGKSTIAQQIAKVCDPTICIERICFTAEEFKQQVKQAKPYQAIVFDEAFTGLSSRSTMSKINKMLVQMIAEIGQKNLFIFIVMPTFFDLDKYFALWRSRALVHVYSNGFERGYFAFYNVDLKKQLYLFGKKTYSYGHPKPNFIGRFPKHYCVDEEAYRKKKLASLEHPDVEEIDPDFEKKCRKYFFKRFYLLGRNIKVVDKAAVLGVTPDTFSRWSKLYRTNPQAFELLELRNTEESLPMPDYSLSNSGDSEDF